MGESEEGSMDQTSTIESILNDKSHCAPLVMVSHIFILKTKCGVKVDRMMFVHICHVVA